MSISAVDRLLQEREIIGLTVQYAWAIDQRRFEDLAEIFSSDGTADYGRLGTFRGPESIAGAIARTLARFDRTQHMVANHEVAIDGDHAHGRCYFQAQHVTQDGAAESNYTVAGQYLDEFRRTEEGWRIAARVLRVIWTDPPRPRDPQRQA